MITGDGRREDKGGRKEEEELRVAVSESGGDMREVQRKLNNNW